MDFHGRWERLSAQPYVLADIGHNAHALGHNFAQLERYINEGRFSSLIIVYGIMADKDLDAILPLMPKCATFIFTTPDTPRALPAAEIMRKFSGNALLENSVPEAVKKALSLATPDTLIYIGGSTFVVAEALPLYGHNYCECTGKTWKSYETHDSMRFAGCVGRHRNAFCAEHR
jgi:dihydrofolate synthase/folylpolyglutamate synthase